jgi:hypothetical protein
MKLYVVYPIIIFLLLLQSCSRDLELPNAGTKKKIVLLGELEANADVSIRAGQSVPITSNDVLRFELIQGLTMKITDNAGATANLPGVEDSLSATLFTIPFTANYKIQPGNTYTVTANHNELGTAIASVTIPKPFVAAVTNYSDVIYGEDSTVKFEIEITNTGGEEYYMIECMKQDVDITGMFFYQGQWVNILYNLDAYRSLKNSGQPVNETFDTVISQRLRRQYVYTNDLNTENLKDGNMQNLFRRVLISSSAFQGATYKTQVYMSKSVVQSGSKGRILLTVKSVSKDYFNYLKQYEGYIVSSSSTFSVAPNIKGNIENGLGMLGGIYKQQFTYTFDRWDF